MNAVILSEYQREIALRAMLASVRQIAREEGRRDGYAAGLDEGHRQGRAVGYYDGRRAWAWATAPLLAVAFGGGLVLAIAIAGWWPR